MKMSPISRLSSVLSHFTSSSSPTSGSLSTVPPKTNPNPHHIHTLSPTSFLPRAAAIEPAASAIYHINSNGAIITRNYREFAGRACGLAYYLLKHNFRRIGILAPNTPAFLETIFAVGGAGGVHVGVNYRLKEADIAYIFDFADVDCVIVDLEFVPLLQLFGEQHPNVPLIVDTDPDPDQTEGGLAGSFNEAVLEGMSWDKERGGRGWDGLSEQVENEDECIAVPFTSGTTARPKGVVYTHRGAYLAALANVVESGLAFDGEKRCGYLWTLPMFHAVGWTFPWAVTAARGTHYCLRKIDYTMIWSLLHSQQITHFNAAPTVNTLLCASPSASRLIHGVRVTVAASPPSAKLFQNMTELNLQPVHCYGLTETYGPITKSYHLAEWDALGPNERFGRMTRQGWGFITSLPVRVIKTRPNEEDQTITEKTYVDVQKDGQEIGEVIFRGNICAKEYYKDVPATHKLWAGGWLHSGDLAVQHADGAVQILDRKKDIIISGGENISSIALENALVAHPKLLEVAVVAVADEKWGERPRAYVTVREGCRVDGDEVIRWAKEEGGISGFMVPKDVMVLDAERGLPKTSTGKVRKNLLREAKW